jgi:hypothetical protein
MTLTRSRALALLARAVAAGGVASGMHFVGRAAGGQLAAPALLHPEGLLAWWEARGPIVATFAALRVGIELAAVYLAALWLVAAASVALPAARGALQALAGRGAPGARQASVLALGAATALAAGMGACSQPGPTGRPAAHPANPARAPVAAEAPVESWLGPPAATVRSQAAPPAATVRSQAAPPAATVRSQAVPPAATSRSQAAPPAVSSAKRQPAPLPVNSRDGVGSSWVVGPGDCLWSIAEATLAAARGRPPTTQEVAPYWLRLIEANRARLPDPDNPSLIFPGEVLDLPPLPGPGRLGQ